jgi:hypothetical protein
MLVSVFVFFGGILMKPTEITIGEYLIHRLYQSGLRHAFGIPGDYVLGFYKPLPPIRACAAWGRSALPMAWAD